MSRNVQMGAGRWLIIKLSNDLVMPDAKSIRGSNVDLQLQDLTVEAVRIVIDGENPDAEEIYMAATKAVITPRAAPPDPPVDPGT